MKIPMNPANSVTIMRMMFIPVFMVVLLGEWPAWATVPGWWSIARPWIAAGVFTLLAATDGLDGYLARSRGEVTTFGKFIDPLADKLLVSAALIALVDLNQLPSWIALVIISREFIVSGLRMVAVAEGKVIAASNLGKVKTVFQIIAIIAFLVKDSALIGDFLGPAIPPLVQVLAWSLMIVAIALTLWSMLDYFYHARAVLTGPWTGENET